MRSSTLILAAASSAIAAETADLFFPGIPGEALYAMSLGQDSTATTYLLGCRKDIRPFADDSMFQQDVVSILCEQGMPVTHTQGPETVHFEQVVPFTMKRMESELMVTQDFQCSLGGKTRAACTMTIDGPGTPALTSYIGPGYEAYTYNTVTLTGTAVAEVFARVPVITDGASMLNYGGASAAKPTGSVIHIAVGGSSEGGVFTGEFVVVPVQTPTAARSISIDSTGGVRKISSATETSAAETATSTAAAAASATAAFEGAAGRMMGLGAWAAAMVAGLVGVVAL